jgi:hypothetical protein
MANVVRLVSGGSIQVRTGVIQGIGPQGPRGVSGSQGIDGAQGPVGETGPMGQILQLSARTTVSTNNPIAATTDTVVNFGFITHDDMQSFSNTAFTFPADGDYLLSAWLRFDAAAATVRELWFAVGAATLARTSRMAGTGAPFYVDLSFPYRALTGQVANVLVRSGSATGISEGSWAVTRVGSGPPGIQGPQGIQGPVGATGAQGPQGTPGSANSGFTKYSDMLPH